eukprot:snap_masked-scaffold_10-processed-gene-8.38-mRNA-1 protein AED:1.00 eAED:1.00 QI:0/0/0/0/1/1/2/0/60
MSHKTLSIREQFETRLVKNDFSPHGSYDERYRRVEGKRFKQETELFLGELEPTKEITSLQ